MLGYLKDQRGIALIFVTISMVVIATALMMVMLEVQKSKHGADRAYDVVILEEAAQAGIEMAVDTLWNNYIANNGNTTGNWASFRYYLDSVVKIPRNEDLNFNGERDSDETGNGDTTFDTYPQGYNKLGWPLLDEPRDFKDPETGRLLATLDSVYVGRYDTIARSILTVTSTAKVGEKSRTAVQLMEIGGQALPHTQFAILANNINCILCHAEFLSLPFEHNTDPSQYGTFDRIKIAALESLMVRKSGAKSNVAGTVYTRGKVYKENGQPMSDQDFKSSTFKGYDFNRENGKLGNTNNGSMNTAQLVNAEVNEEGNLEQFSNLYMDYPDDQNAQTDGPLPNSFPAPYPDENENRMVDDSEFEVIVNSANGRIDFTYADEENVPGSIQAGVAYGVPEGSMYMDDHLPENSNSALDTLASTGSYEGNLILVGSEDDPIQIDKSVAIDGDLVIAGPIQGSGQLLVRGNAYIVGDVTYADDPGEYGEYTDNSGNIKENAFALVAGGSIMMGDYLTVRGVNHTKDTSQYPNKAYSIRSRETTKSKKITYKSYSKETIKYGYYDKDSVDAGEIVSGRQGQQFSFTTSELMLFNNLELEKAIEDPDYTPRFYGLRESQPDNIYVWDSSEEHATYYNRKGVHLLSDYLADEGLPMSLMDDAALHYCNPSANWMSEDTLRNIWYADEMSRPKSGRDFLFDGLLYSNNSIWCIVRSNTRHGSYTNGQMRIRGGVIAADLGMFVPGNGQHAGLNLLYDPRVERFLEIRDTSQVSFNRVAFYFARGEQEI